MPYINTSMEDYLRVVIPHLDPELVSSEALARIQALAQILPPFSIAGFECRLGSEQSRVDFQVNFPPLNLNLPESFLTHSVWQTFQDFCQQCIDPKSILHRSVESLWLEFDLPEQSSQVPIPCFFLVLNQENNIGEFQDLTETVLSLLNYPTNSLLESNLRLCANSVPDGGKIAHLGAMLSRTAKEVRVVVKGISSQQLLDYLVKIGWTNITNTLESLVFTLSEFADTLGLSFDVGDIVHPRIGLEYFWEKQPPDEPRWPLFLDRLVEMGLCTPAKRNALLAWPGFSQKADLPELWPTNLAGSDLFLGSKALSVFWRKNNHIKIIYEPDNPLEAKAYIGFGHTWWTFSELTRRKVSNIEDDDRTSLPSSNETEVEVSQYLKQVCSYYDRMNPLYLKYVGKTYQAGLLETDSEEADPYLYSNLYFAQQAGIQPGHRILDAGCGVCGPSIDIASNIKGIRIDAITLSSVQADTARELVQQAGLADQIQVHIGDFHHLPFADEVFDVVFFLESTGYSYDHQRLFAEVYRVLRPGGNLYIKDLFSKELPLSNQEQQELAEFSRIYTYKTTKISEIKDAIVRSDFQEITSYDLRDISTTKLFIKAMFESTHGLPRLTEFGKFHYCQLQCLPIYFAEIKARKPST